ncbi:hypothetical protein V6N13_081182 [Hibiscus sabdariffa]
MAWGVHFSIWCWLLWKLRCCRILDEEFLEREGIFEKGCRLIAECEHSFGLDAPMQVTEPRHWLWWVGPARGWVKLNVDVACSVLIAELWVVFDGLHHAWALNFRRIELETDNKEVERILCCASPTLESSALVMAIHEWLQRDWIVSVNHVSRERNSVADSLVAMGRDCGMHGSLFDGPPGSIAGRLEEERHHWASMRPTMNRIDDPCG